MEVNVFRNSQGFTLIEVLVAMVVLAIGFLGAMGTMIAALDANHQNVLRNEAVKMAQERLENMRNTPYPAVVTEPSLLVERQVRKQPWTFQMMQTVKAGDHLKVVEIEILWAYKSRNHSYRTSTVLYQPVS